MRATSPKQPWDEPTPAWLRAPRLSRPGIRLALVASLTTAGAAGATAWALLGLARSPPADALPAAASPTADTPPAADPHPTADGAPAPSETLAAAPAAAPWLPESAQGVLLPAEPASPVEPPAADPAPASHPARQHWATRPHLRPPEGVGAGLEVRWIRQGSRLARHAQFHAALKAFQRAAGVNLRSADAWYGMALCDYELRRDAASQQAAEQARWADPSHAMTNLLLGFLRQQAGHPDQARQFYERYLAQEPDGEFAEEIVSVLDQLPHEG
jgi:hypothetical protein